MSRIVQVGYKGLIKASEGVTWILGFRGSSAQALCSILFCSPPTNERVSGGSFQKGYESRTDEMELAAYYLYYIHTYYKATIDKGIHTDDAIRLKKLMRGSGILFDTM